ncbi:hypothetical protein SF06_28850 [Pseudomonas flexibilis]|nr:hypothetical protein SF06_28850 [Pseudomonas flexibilis]
MLQRDSSVIAHTAGLRASERCIVPCKPGAPCLSAAASERCCAPAVPTPFKVVHGNPHDGPSRQPLIGTRSSR